MPDGKKKAVSASKKKATMKLISRIQRDRKADKAAGITLAVKAAEAKLRREGNKGQLMRDAASRVNRAMRRKKGT